MQWICRRVECVLRHLHHPHCFVHVILHDDVGQTQTCLTSQQQTSDATGRLAKTGCVRAEPGVNASNTCNYSNNGRRKGFSRGEQQWIFPVYWIFPIIFNGFFQLFFQGVKKWWNFGLLTRNWNFFAKKLISKCKNRKSRGSRPLFLRPRPQQQQTLRQMCASEAAALSSRNLLHKSPISNATSLSVRRSTQVTALPGFTKHTRPGRYFWNADLQQQLQIAIYTTVTGNGRHRAKPHKLAGLPLLHEFIRRGTKWTNTEPRGRQGTSDKWNFDGIFLVSGLTIFLSLHFHNKPFFSALILHGFN